MDMPGEKLVIKLWETLIEKGVGSLLEPWQTARVGKVRNEVRRNEILMLSQAEKDAADIRAGRKYLNDDGTLIAPPGGNSTGQPLVKKGVRVEPIINLEHIIEKSLETEATERARKEISVCKAIIVAEEVLANDPQEPPDNKVEDDWLFAWREMQDASPVKLQQLWGQVLAGEVKSPGSYSYRTLEFLKGLSKDEAEKISTLARFVIEGRIVRSQSQDF